MSHATKPTLLDYAILGLIREEPASGYEIRKAFETTALGNYSSSPGSIYPALKRLRKLELVEKVTLSKTGKAKIRITAKGVECLRDWLLLPVEKRNVERDSDELLLRFAFMDKLVGKEQQLDFLTNFRDQLRTYLAELQTYHKEEGRHNPLTGRLAFEHGMMIAEATLQWCERAIGELTKNTLQ